MSVHPAATDHPFVGRHDQRAEPRRSLCVPATVYLADGPVMHASSTNISAHGIDLRCAQALPPATRCEVEIDLPLATGHRRVRTQACVVRSDNVPAGFSAGLVFFGMPERTQELLELFVCGG